MDKDEEKDEDNDNDKDEDEDNDNDKGKCKGKGKGKGKSTFMGKVRDQVSYQRLKLRVRKQDRVRFVGSPFI
jgi:hypothetical protein